LRLHEAGILRAERRRAGDRPRGARLVRDAPVHVAMLDDRVRTCTFQRLSTTSSVRTTWSWTSAPEQESSRSGQSAGGSAPRVRDRGDADRQRGARRTRPAGVLDARKRLLKPGARLIPSAILCLQPARRDPPRRPSARRHSRAPTRLAGAPGTGLKLEPLADYPARLHHRLTVPIDEGARLGGAERPDPPRRARPCEYRRARPGGRSPVLEALTARRGIGAGLRSGLLPASA
jgi:hypothetical protein